jgi:Zn-dependent protease
MSSAETAPFEAPRFCAQCGTAMGDGALACPGCQTLVYAAQLEALAGRAKAAEGVGNRAGAAEAWSAALPLLPPESAQYRTISAHLATLVQPAIEAPAAEPHPGRTGWRKLVGSVGVLGALIWKFKFALLYILGKGKFLLFGLTKLSTLLSMFASFGLYWTLYGWAFAAGFVVCIYIHEMGHIWQLRQYGIKSSAPLFLPGFGAVVFVHDRFTPQQDARVGLAGPIWGTGAALACWAMAAFTQEQIWVALAQAGAMINLFNLIPVWQLDGGRAFNGQTRKERLILTGVAALLWFALKVPMFFLILLGCGYRLVFAKDPAREPDTKIAIEYAGLMVVLGLLSGLPVVH